MGTIIALLLSLVLSVYPHDKPQFTGGYNGFGKVYHTMPSTQSDDTRESVDLLARKYEQGVSHETDKK